MIVYRRSSTVGSFTRAKSFLTTLRFIHNDLIGRRHIADYEAERLGRVVAERCVQKARDMVAVIAQRLEESCHERGSRLFRFGQEWEALARS